MKKGAHERILFKVVKARRVIRKDGRDILNACGEKMCHRDITKEEDERKKHIKRKEKRWSIKSAGEQRQRENQTG